MKTFLRVETKIPEVQLVKYKSDLVRDLSLIKRDNEDELVKFLNDSVRGTTKRNVTNVP